MAPFIAMIHGSENHPIRSADNSPEGLAQGFTHSFIHGLQEHLRRCGIPRH